MTKKRIALYLATAAAGVFLAILVNRITVKHENAPEKPGHDHPPEQRISLQTTGDVPGLTVHVLCARGGQKGPLASALVEVARVSPLPAADAGESSSQHCDSTGNARFMPLAPGEYSVWISAEGYLSSYTTSEIPKDQGVLCTVTLDLLASLTGVVLDEDGKPAEGAHVKLDFPPDARKRALRPTSFPAAALFCASTGPNGRFHLGGLPSGYPFRVDVSHVTSGSWHRRMRPIRPGTCGEVVVRLQGHSSLRGAVFRTGSDAEDTTVKLWHQVGAACRLKSEGRMHADADGEFIFRDVISGMKTLSSMFQSDGIIEFGYATAEAVQGQMVDVGTITVLPTTVNLLVTSKNDIAGRRVAIIGELIEHPGSNAVWPLHIEARVGEQIELRGLRAGKLNLTGRLLLGDDGSLVADTKYEDAQFTGQFSGSSLDVTLEIKTRPHVNCGDVLVELEYPGSANINDNAPVIVLFRGEEILRTRSRWRRGESSVLVGNVDAGSACLLVLSKGYVSSAQVVDIQAGKRAVVAVDGWRRAATLHGHVRGLSGSSPQRAVVSLQLRASDGNLHDLARDVCDESGRYELPCLRNRSNLELWVAHGRKTQGPFVVPKVTGDHRIDIKLVESE